MRTQRQATAHTETVVAHLGALGFFLNHEKSSLVPSRRTTFLGVRLDSSKLWARLSTEWTQTFRSCLASFQVGIEVPYLTCMCLAGFMASAIHFFILRLGRFHMRPYQRWLNALRIPSTQRNCMVRVTTACMRSLRP